MHRMTAMSGRLSTKEKGPSLKSGGPFRKLRLAQPDLVRVGIHNLSGHWIKNQPAPARVVIEIKQAIQCPCNRVG